jgi:hypothetical protein
MFLLTFSVDQNKKVAGKPLYQGFLWLLSELGKFEVCQRLPTLTAN